MTLYNVASTSMQRHDVASTLMRRSTNAMRSMGCIMLYDWGVLSNRKK